MKNSTRTTVKLGLVFGMMICLLIPQISILELIRERSGYQHEATAQIAAQWGARQTIIGPILSIPFIEYNAKDEVVKRFAYFMPDELNAQSDVEVDLLEKSIYKIPVYTSNNKLKVKFKPIDFSKWNVDLNEVVWDQATLIMRVSDAKGILNTPTIKFLDSKLEFDAAGNSVLGSASMSIALNKKLLQDGFAGVIEFDLKGTEALHLAPLGKATSYAMNSNWPHPNFQGIGAGFAPVDREVNEAGFNATWKSTKFNAAYAYEWLDHALQLDGQYMGVNFYQMSNHYTKAERSVKYMLLIVGLIFLSFLLSELLNKMKIHPFQYILVGASIVIFYLLLLAISEYAGYNISYLISSFSTVVLVATYCSSVFKSHKMVLLEALLLIALFVFLFVIINAMEYSLLMGAVGLFVILGVTMYFTRKIQWYDESDE